MEKLKINGVDKQFPKELPATLADLLDKMSLDKATVAAEIDGKIIDKKHFGQTKLNKNQKIELLRFIGGGK